jgi:hypothetical protein
LGEGTGGDLYHVIRKTYWRRAFGNPQGGDGIVGQVTHVRIDGVNAYVRENVRVNTFTEINSNLRRAIALGEAEMPGIQVLELATETGWDEVAAKVREIDALHRLVVKSPRWTVKVARRTFRAVDCLCPADAA